MTLGDVLNCSIMSYIILKNIFFLRLCKFRTYPVKSSCNIYGYFNSPYFKSDLQVMKMTKATFSKIFVLLAAFASGNPLLE